MDVSISTNTPEIIATARSKAAEYEAEGINRPFCLVDLSRVRSQLKLWRSVLPSVKPYYAVKCNNDDAIVSVLAEEGCGFDCATLGEIQQVLGISRNADIIVAHPIKTRECIDYATSQGISRMTFDSMEELLKMKETSCDVEPILRIKVNGFNSLVNMNSKFGADGETSKYILQAAATMKISIVGLSFHIGSGVEDCRPIERVLAIARSVLDFGRKYGHPMELLDIGGGMVYSNDQDMFKLGFFIERALDIHFGGTDVTVIAEPGRFLVNNCQYAVARVLQVTPKTIQVDHNAEYNVFINDGVYGSFNYVLTEQREAVGYPLTKRRGTMRCDIWGPTCCSFDIVEKNRRITWLCEGDWLIYSNNGAYSNVLGTTFNGLPVADRFYVGEAKSIIIHEHQEEFRSKL